MSARLVLACAGVMALSGCNPQVTRLTVNEQTLGGRDQVSLAACPMRLLDVVDQRVDRDTGGLGWNQVVVEDPPKLVRDQLLKAGMLSADADSGMAVVVRLKQMYLSQNNMTKNPVVVYEAVIDGGAPILVRAQPTIGNWAGSRNEAMHAMSNALHEANFKLLSRLNESCATRS